MDEYRPPAPRRRAAGGDAAGRVEQRAAAWALIGIAVLALTGIALLGVPASPTGQALLLVHVAVGALILLPVVAYVAWHARRLWSKDRGRSRTVALVATLAVTGVLASGAYLAVSYTTSLGAAPLAKTLHGWTAAIALVLLPVHALASLVRRPEGLRPIRPLSLGLAAVTASALATALIAAVIRSDGVLEPVGADYPRTPDGEIFSASFTQTAHGGFVAARGLTGSETCGGCHDEIFREWSVSTHRFSGVDNPLIATATEAAEKKGGLPAARFCASCHEPVAMLAGTVTQSNFTASPLQQGVTCLVCHGVSRVPGRRGNGEMVYAPPDTFAFFNAGTPGATRLNRLLIETFVDDHRRAMRPPLLDNSHQCSSCHTVNAHAGLNGIGFIRLHNDNDDWGLSSFSHGVGPEGRVVRCQDCHMGKESGSHDPVAARNGGTHRSHRFLAANTFVARNFGDDEQLRLTERFLRGEGVPREIRDLVPAGPPVTVAVNAPTEVAAGHELSVSVVLSNRGVGHAFPAGPNEINETWVELLVRDEQGEIVFSSGALDGKAERDPAAFALISIPVDAEGKEVFVTAGLSAGFRLRRAILHGASDEQSYRIPVPPTAAGRSLRVSARLRYRKSDAPFARLLTVFSIADVPITDIAGDEVSVHVTGGEAPDRVRLQDPVPDPPPHARTAPDQTRPAGKTS